jgi:DNA polymerase elongation subunit (family B)
MGIKFQILDIGSDDVNFEFIITLYGKNIKNENIVCHIKDFRPSFYVRVHEDNFIEFKKIINIAMELSLEEIIKKSKEGKSMDEDDLKEAVAKKMVFYTDKNCNYYCGMEYSNIQEKKSFYNFSFDDNEKFKFYKLSFKSKFSMDKYSNAIKKYYKHCIENIDKDFVKKNIYLKGWLKLAENNCDCEANLYESKVHPILKFIHETDIKSCGWVEINGQITKKSRKIFNCDYEYDNINYKNVKYIENDDISDFVICSYDIECDSSHGDFPNPKKNFKKLAIEIYDILNKWNAVTETIILTCIRKCIEVAFGNVDNKYDISLIYTTPESYDNLDEVMEKFKSMFTSKETTEAVHFYDSKKRNESINKISSILENLKHGDSRLKVDGDPIIQIGNVFYNYITKKYKRVIVVYKDNVKEDEICTNLDKYDIEVITCKTEKELLLKWVDVIVKHNPDFVTGYNIFGFDFNFISQRVDELFDNVEKDNFYKIGKILKNSKEYYSKQCKTMNKQLSSSGLGDNELKFIQMDGRILFDMQKEIQKSHPLESYKLDNVSSYFMRGKMIPWPSYERKGNNYYQVFDTNNVGYLKEGDYIYLNIHTKWGQYKYQNKKYQLHKIDYTDKEITLISNKNFVIEDAEFIEWSMAKDDITPQDIFDKHKFGTADDRALIAKYCIMDCELCIQLMVLLDILPNNVGMAKVCYVPLSYIFLRGQGIKVNSLVTRECNNNNILIPTLKSYDPNNKEGFEGAIVLDPVERDTTGMYLVNPIAVVDYASLYPSSIIENNFSHDTFICTEKDYLENPSKYNKFKEMNDFEYTSASYGDYEFTEKFKKGDEVFIKGELLDEKFIIDKVEKSSDEDDDTKYYIIQNKGGKYLGDKLMKCDDKKWDKNKLDTETTCYFKSQFNNYNENIGPKYGIIPRILKTLLDERSATKKLIKQAKTDDKKKVLDGLQLAYKVTANSVYGQMGAKTSSIFFKKIAACTTAIGRQRIYDAENGTIEWAESAENTLISKDVKKKVEIIYGDTDSVFIKFALVDINNNPITDRENIITHCIDCGISVGEYVTNNYLNKNFKGKKYKGEPIEKTKFKGPQDLEYEKTFENFILISKKRYIGDKHEFKFTTEPARTSMGIVMKRRDNAPIVKYVYGNILEILMHLKNVDTAKHWLDKTLNDIYEGKKTLEMFIITKSLRADYKNPKAIAHKVLADRIGERDPGNKPKSNDRIPYAYVKVDDEPIITGYRPIWKKIKDGLFKNGNQKYKTVKERGEAKYKKKHILQGDRIEHKDYIIQKKLDLDYKFYISNQIMKPVKQLLEIQIEADEIDKIFNKYI